MGMDYFPQINRYFDFKVDLDSFVFKFGDFSDSRGRPDINYKCDDSLLNISKCFMRRVEKVVLIFSGKWDTGASLCRWASQCLPLFTNLRELVVDARSIKLDPSKDGRYAANWFNVGIRWAKKNLPEEGFPWNPPTINVVVTGAKDVAFQFELE
jgi:hypothetical protein